jgi:small-conductance mechanosensitive channel
VSEYLTPERIAMLLRAVFTFFLGVVLARVIAGWVSQAMARRGRAQEALIARRITFYGLLCFVLAMTLHELGFHLGVLFGAAGILTVAIGFASQTSASNLVSGIFLIAERSFVVGDTIQIGEHTGEILSIDLLSVKLRTFDNILVRVPNEEIIRSRVKNMTHFAIRRADAILRVPHDADLARARAALLAAASSNPQCLADPAPEFTIVRFTDSGIELQLSVWTRREGFAGLQTWFREEVRNALHREGLSISLPPLVVQGEASSSSPTPAS